MDEDRKQQVEASLEVYRRWREAGQPLDLTQFVKDIGLDRDDESAKPSADFVVSAKPPEKKG